jgi:hypothetical protein
MEDKRSFTVLSVSTKRNTKSSANAGGRFISSTPSGAARKAAGQVCRGSKIRGQCTLFVTIQETTRGSSGKSFTYKVKRVVVNAQVNHGGKVVNHKYSTKVHKA